MRGSAAAPLVDALLFQRSTGGWTALLPLHPAGDEPVAAPVRTALQGLDGRHDVQVVDIARELDSLYAHYLDEALVQALWVRSGVVALLAWHLRSVQRLARVCLPLVLAVLLTLGGLALLDVALGILHLVGLLLVIAVGSNYGLFFDQLRNDRRADPDTLASLLLANLTTVASFGLIALSEIPALSAIGRVVAPGALLALLLAAAMARVDRKAPPRAGLTARSARTLVGKSRPAPLPAAGSQYRMATVPVPQAAGWPMPGFVKASVGVHLLAAGAAVAAPSLAGWALAGVAANHLALVAAGLLPRSDLIGPNLTRLDAAHAARGEIALTIDDGPDPQVTPALLDVLDALGIRATFFCIAERAQRHPELTRRIAARGHSVQNHSHHHRLHFSLFGPRRMTSEIAGAQQILADLTGRAPVWFRAPAGLRNPFLDPVLHRLGLRLASWTRRGFDTREADPQQVLARLTRGLAGGDILLLHDGHAARSRPAGGRCCSTCCPGWRPRRGRRACAG